MVKSNCCSRGAPEFLAPTSVGSDMQNTKIGLNFLNESEMTFKAQ